MINGIVYCDDEDAITTIANVLENLNGPERQLHLDLYNSDINIPVTERCGSTLPAPLDIKITDPKQPEVGITKLFTSIATFNLFFSDNQIGADDGDSKIDEPGNERVKEEDSDLEMADHQPGNDNQRVEVEWQEKGLGEQDDEDEEDDIGADDSEMDELGNKCVKEEDDDSEMADHQPGNDDEEFGGVNHQWVEVEWQEKGLGEQDDEEEDDEGLGEQGFLYMDEKGIIDVDKSRPIKRGVYRGDLSVKDYDRLNPLSELNDEVPH